jgi:hypothetical protein
MQQYVKRVLLGQLGLSGIDRGFLDIEDARLVAHRAYSKVDRDFTGKPWDLIWGLGIIPVVMGNIGVCRELADSNRIVYRHLINPRERYLALFHGIAHIILRREGWEHSEPDVWLVTAELAAPWGAIQGLGLETVLKKSTVPAWLVHAWALARKQHLYTDNLA